MRKRCIIIGSGLGGLSVGAILARNGYEVKVLEQGRQMGGCLQCFERGGTRFETGMHMVGSLDEGEVLWNYLNFLGIRDKVELSRLNSEAYDIVSLRGERFAFPNGHEAMIDALGNRFPKEKDHLRNYWKAVDMVAQATPYYNLNKKRTLSDNDLMYASTHSINEVLDSIIDDEMLKEVLVGNISLYAARRDRTPFLTHAFVADFYNRSAFRIVGGSDSLTKALANEIIRHGGEICLGSRVIKANSKGGKLQTVTLSNGEEYQGDLFISDIHPSLMVDLFDGEQFRMSYIERLRTIENTTSVFSLFLKFRPNEVPYLNSNFYGYTKGGSPWEMDDYSDETWPRGYLYMHHAQEKSPHYAEGGVILAYLTASDVNHWSNTTIGHRGPDYEEYKYAKAKQLMAIVEHDFPGLSSHVEQQYTATPLTYRDYTLTPEGSMYGMAKDITLGVAGRVSYRTKIPNLFLVGQNIKAHGILGVLVSTIDVAEAILGHEIVRKQMLERNITSHTTVSTFPTHDILILGGGLGGLMCGALLAKEGQSVTVLEKNNKPGGGLLCFQRGKSSFPTGMHVFGGFNQGGQLYKLCQYLGILDKIKILDASADNIDEVVNLKTGAHYFLPHGREAYTQYLCQQFPHQTDNIQAYIDALYRLSEEEGLFYLRPDQGLHCEEFFWPADFFISQYITDDTLRNILTYLVPLYGGVAGETPAYMHALINILHIEGASQFVGGSQQLADALVKVIEENGGRVLCGERVEQMEVHEHRITKIKTTAGHHFQAKTYINDMPITELIRVAPIEAFPLAFRRRMEEAPCSYSAFKVNIQLEKGDVPLRHSTTFYFQGEQSAWHQFDGGEDAWPRVMMAIVHPFSDTITLISPMPFSWVERWEKTTLGHRGESYAKWKQEKIERLLEMLKKTRPEIFDHIMNVEASSPLTIRDYYGNKKGSMYGLHRDCNNMMLTQLSAYTKIKNLFLTGQDVNIHGLCGVSLTAVSTAETVLNDNTLRLRINKLSMKK